MTACLIGQVNLLINDGQVELAHTCSFGNLYLYIMVSFAVHLTRELTEGKQIAGKTSPAAS